MAMIRKECAGDYQVGIYRVTRLLKGKANRGAGPWLVEDRDGNFLRRFRSLAAAYLQLTGEPLRETSRGHL